MSSHVLVLPIKRGSYAKNYYSTDILAALDAYVQAKRTGRSLSYRQAGQSYNIPHTTLRDYHLRYLKDNASSPRYSTPSTIMEQTVQSVGTKRGHRLLPDEVEKKLKEWIDISGDLTDPPSVPLIRKKAKRLYFSLHKIPITDENKNLLMSRKWWRCFKKRYPSLRVRRPRPLHFARARATQPEIINHFYDLLKYQLDTHGFQPHQIYAADETGISGDIKQGKVVGDKCTNKKHT